LSIVVKIGMKKIIEHGKIGIMNIDAENGRKQRMPELYTVKDGGTYKTSLSIKRKLIGICVSS